MADWFTIDKNSGSGDGNVIITASSNEELMEKIAKLRVTTLNGRTKDVSVREKAFKTAPSTLIFPYKNAETQSLHIYCSNGWTISKPDWVLVSSTSGQGDGFISVNVEDNEDLYREGVITITASNGMVRTISVAQAEMEHHTISVSPDMLEFGYKGGDFTINIVTDYEWIAVPPAGVALSQYSGVGNAVVTGTKGKNESEDVYSGVIVLSTDTDSASVMIAQSGKPSPESIWIEVTPSSYEFSKRGGSVTFTMRTNGEDWSMSEPTFGTIETNDVHREGDMLIGTFTLTADATDNSRDGYIVFNGIMDGEVIVNEEFIYRQIVHITGEPFRFRSYGTTSLGTSCIDDVHWENLEYSFDGDSWATLENGVPVTFSGYLYIRGDNNRFNNGNYGTFFKVYEGSDVDVEGDIKFLLSKNGTKTISGMDMWECFKDLFRGLPVVSASGLVLPSETIQDGFKGMFANCTKLIAPPELPAETLAESCYEGMFQGCTSLTTTPYLPAETLANRCYYGMFEDCTSLTNALPLPAKIVTSSSYERMFAYCTGLITAPEILAENCNGHYSFKNMFYKCSSLINMPILSNIRASVGTFSFMFSECTSLVDASQSLLSVSNDAYLGMFQGCTSLLYPPTLPNDVRYGCYQQMFKDCINLEIAPELPSVAITETASDCYLWMFYNCPKLREMRCAAKKVTGNYQWMAGTSPNGTFYIKPNATYRVDDTYGIPTGWTIAYY